MLKSANMTNIKTTWNFSKLYKDIDDKKIELDIKNIDKLFKAFAKKYEDRKFIKSSKSLLEALNDYNILSKNTSSKPLWYLGLQQALNSSNNDIQSQTINFWYFGFLQIRFEQRHISIRIICSKIFYIFCMCLKFVFV
jgi:oligoendopeptidase F